MSAASRGLGRCNPLPALRQAAEGAGSLVGAAGLPARGYRRLLPGCVRVSFWSLLSVGACCWLLRVASYPLRLLLPESAAVARWTGWGTLASAAAGFAVYAVQGLLPWLCGPLFLGALELRDPALAEVLRGLPAKRSPSRQLLRSFAGLALAAAAVAAACAFAGPAVASLIAAVGFFLTVYWWCVALVALLGLAAYYVHEYVLHPIFAVDSVFAVVLLASVALGICREDVWAAALQGSVLYVSSAWLVSKCLTPFAVRQDLGSWEAFRRRHRWRIFGFGLGPALVLQARPVLGLALLGWLHLAAAGLTADLHAADRRAAPDMPDLLA